MSHHWRLSCYLWVVLAASNFMVIDGWNVFECSHSKPWPVDWDDDGAATIEFQNYINANQYDCDSGRPIQQDTSANFGIGAALSFSAIDLIKTFEYSAIYRPTGDWNWASAPGCSMHSTNTWGGTTNRTRYFVDCYFTPLSTCMPVGMPYNTDVSISDFRRNLTAAKAYLKYPTDTCTAAFKTKKSLLWVFGNFVQYHMRLNSALVPKIAAKIDSVFPDRHRLRNKNYFLEGHPLDNIEKLNTEKALGKNRPSRRRRLRSSEFKQIDEKTCVTAALHVRNGMPDGHRHSLSGVEHIEMLDKFAVEFALQNKKICEVYVSAFNLDDTIFANPNKMANIAYNIKTLNRTDIPDKKTETEYVLNSLKAAGFPVHDIVAEYLLDIMLMGIADIYIGSHSNLFTIAAGLRRVWHPTAPMNHTSFLNSIFSPPHWVPLDQSVDFWNSWPMNEGGFRGGVGL